MGRGYRGRRCGGRDGCWRRRGRSGRHTVTTTTVGGGAVGAAPSAETPRSAGTRPSVGPPRSAGTLRSGAGSRWCRGRGARGQVGPLHEVARRRADGGPGGRPGRRLGRRGGGRTRTRGGGSLPLLLGRTGAQEQHAAQDQRRRQQSAHRQPPSTLDTLPLREHHRSFCHYRAGTAILAAGAQVGKARRQPVMPSPPTMRVTGGLPVIPSAARNLGRGLRANRPRGTFRDGLAPHPRPFASLRVTA